MTWIGADDAVQGERVHTSRTGRCDDLMEEIALAISIAIDALDAAARATPRPVAAPEPLRIAPLPAPPPSRPAPALRRPPPVSDARGRRATFMVAVGAAALFGSQPEPGVGITLALGAAWRWLSIYLEGRLDAPVSVTAPAGGGATTERRSLALIPCGSFAVSARWRFEGCGLATVGWLSGRGTDVSLPREDATWIAAAGARAGLSIELARLFSVRLHADLAVPIRRAVARLGRDTLWQEAAVTGAIGLAGVLRFP